MKARGNDGRYLARFGLPAIRKGLAIPPKDARGYWHYTYTVRDPVTSEWYAGVHSTRRLTDGYSGSGIWLRKHSEPTRLKFTVEAFYSTGAAASEAEVILILLDDPFCRNRMPGGNTLRRVVGDPEVRARISKARKRLFMMRPGLSAAFADLGRMTWENASPEMLANQAEHGRNIWNDPDLRGRMLSQSARNKGQPLPVEWAANIAAAVPTKDENPDFHKNKSAGAYKRWNTPGFRKKAQAINLATNAQRAATMSAENRKRWTDPEYKARVSAAISAAKKGKPRSRQFTP